MVGATSVPYFVNWLHTPPGYDYTWLLPVNPQDQFAYMAWAQQAARGAVLFKIKYTALPQTPFLFHPFFLICGWLSAILRADLGFTFFAVKAVCVVTFFASFYRYLDFLCVGRIAFIAGSVLVGLSAGVGEIFALLGMNPEILKVLVNYVLPEVSTYWSLLCNPLLTFSLTLMVLAIYWADKGTCNGRVSYMWASGAATGLTALIHPYNVPLLFVWVASVSVARGRERAPAYLLRYFAAALPPALYVLILSKLLPLVALHSVRGLMPRYSILFCLLGFGLPLFLAIAGFLLNPRQTRQHCQVGAWFLLAIALTYLPVWFQAKLIFGAQIPLCILAGTGFAEIYATVLRSRFPRALATAGALLFLVLASATSMYVLAIQTKVDPNDLETGSFIRRDLKEGIGFLARNSKPEDLVFADFTTSRYIAAYAGNTVVWGHWAMSVDFKQRQEWATKIFNPNSDWDDAKRVREFYGSGIRFIFLDEQLELRLEEQPATMQLILGKSEKIFENGAVAIYRALGN